MSEHRAPTRDVGSTQLGWAFSPSPFFRYVVLHASNPQHQVHLSKDEFHDLRAKAGTDKADAADMRSAQQQLGHKNLKTTEVESCIGDEVTPTR